jgi:hypothetical protein
MRSRQLALGILLAFVLITVETSSIYAAHTTPLPKTSRGAKITLTVGSIDAAGTFSFTANGANNPKVVSWIETPLSSSGLTCNVVPAGDAFDTAGSYRCPFGGLTATGTVGTTSVTVTVENKATGSNGARIVFKEGDSSNVWNAKNYILKNTLPTGSATIAVRLDVEITLDDKTNALLQAGAGRGHASVWKAQFYSCLTGTSCLTGVPTGARFIGTSEFIYYDDTTSGIFREQVGGGAGASSKVDYTVSSTNPANMGSGTGKCVGEGDPDDSSDSCFSAPTSFTKCPSNFGSCATMENLFSRMIYGGLKPQFRVEVGAGNQTGSAVPINEEIGACASLASFQLAESIFGEGSCLVPQGGALQPGPGEGKIHVNLFGNPDVDLRTCDLEGATAGIGGAGMNVQGFAIRQLDGFESLGPGVADDVVFLFEGESGAGKSCLGSDHSETIQIIVTCPVRIVCDDVNQQGQGFRLVSSTDAVLDVPLVCATPVEVFPCP